MVGLLNAYSMEILSTSAKMDVLEVGLDECELQGLQDSQVLAKITGLCSIEH